MSNRMSIVRRVALGAWYYSSLPWREVQWGAAPVTILFYHRVADEYPNPWTLSNADFTEQIEWLRRRFDLVSLEEAQRRIRTSDSPRPAVAITFDDGYAENCGHALPLLIKLKIPCTYFVATRFVLNGESFPHDAQAGRPLPVNTPEQIRALANAGIEIGAHTRNHIDLGPVTDLRVLEDEISGAADDLAAITGRRPRCFAFPYGLHRNLNAEAFHLARNAGYEGVCSAYGGYNTLGGDPFHLKRFHGDPDLLRVKNWVTIDPRKAYTVLPFHYERLTRQATEVSA
jgi:peptidoglycan/xylan/chitin deacetylase (PgdA/CDA1 family)